MSPAPNVVLSGKHHITLEAELVMHVCSTARVTGIRGAHK